MDLADYLAVSDGSDNEIRAGIQFSAVIMQKVTEDSVSIPDKHTTNKSANCDENYSLLRWRMATLGLDPYLIECGETQAFHEIERRCAECDVRDACAMDLMGDPKNPLWESYCPNSRVIDALVKAWWLPRLSDYVHFRSLGGRSRLI
jgi:hypothetical protein